jgi:hypothetical protein
MGLIGSMLGLAGCGGGNSWHQKLIVTVNTPNGEVAGSSVSKVGISFAEDTWLAPVYAYSAGQTGEAVVVEVAPGKFLFALLNDRQRLLAFRVFFDDNAEASPNKKQAIEIQNSRKSADLQANQYPTLVTFTDINNPRTVKIVDPMRLSEAFGAGYSLKSITLEITDEAVTEGQVIKIARWLDHDDLLFIDWKKYPIDHPLQRINWQSFRLGN